MQKGEWGVESNDKLLHLFIGRTTALVPEVVVIDLPLGRTLWWYIWNPCAEFRWSPEDPVSQIHTPHHHTDAPGIFSDLLRSVQMLKRVGAEINGKLPHLFIPSKTANLYPEFVVEDQPSAELQPRFLSLLWRICPWAEHSPRHHVGAPGIFSYILRSFQMLIRSVQMLKGKWFPESNGKLLYLFIPGKTATLVPEFAVEYLPSAELQPRFLRLQWRTCHWAEHSMMLIIISWTCILHFPVYSDTATA